QAECQDENVRARSPARTRQALPEIESTLGDDLPRRLRKRRPQRRGLPRFLNATTFGGVLGFLCGVGLGWAWTAGSYLYGRDVIVTLVTALFLGVVGSAVGVVLGFVLDSLITLVLYADSEPTRQHDEMERERR